MHNKTLLLGIVLLMAAFSADAGNKSGNTAYTINMTGSGCKVSKLVISDLSGTTDAVAVDMEEAFTLGSTPRPISVNAPKKAFRKGFTVKVFDADGNALGFATSLKAPSKTAVLDIPDNGEPALEAARGYYKDIFQNAGCYITSYLTLPAADFLGLKYDTMGTKYESCDKKHEADSAYQHDIICGTDYDHNGVLLYPDGEPRYRMVYMNGGRATKHGRTLTEEGRGNFRTFIANGGSYLGSCAGAYISSTGTTNVIPNYLHLIPVRVKGTGYLNGETGMFIAKDSPLLKYDDFGKDMYVDSVHHEGGCYLPDENVTKDVEILARYDKPDLKLHEHISVWAYKPDEVRGRVIACGSHPEQVKDGERRDFMAAMLQYALDGSGSVNVKGVLENGKSEEAVIGDRQYHHFKLVIPEGAKNIRLTVNGGGNHNLELALRKGALAWRSDADFLQSQNGEDKVFSFKSLEAGVWYVSIYCPDTVTVSYDYQKFEYSGDVSVLNGVPYTVEVSWK